MIWSPVFRVWESVAPQSSTNSTVYLPRYDWISKSLITSSEKIRKSQHHLWARILFEGGCYCPMKYQGSSREKNDVSKSFSIFLHPMNSCMFKSGNNRLAGKSWKKAEVSGVLISRLQTSKLAGQYRRFSFALLSVTIPLVGSRFQWKLLSRARGRSDKGDDLFLCIHFF